MEELSEEYLTNLFNSFHRESLSCRRKRQVLVKRIKSLVDSSGDKKSNCIIVVKSIIEYHRKAKAENGSICVLGKYHNVLYIGVKLCYDFLITETEVVADLLMEIFQCENTFERILAGAIYGVNVAHFIAGWKSDFKDQEENIAAVGYFLKMSCNGKLKFPMKTETGVEIKKFADVPMSPVNCPPVAAALQMANVEMVHLLLRFDANLNFKFSHIYPAHEEISAEETKCVNILFRSVISVSEIDKKNSRYENLVCFDPPSLKHLCRCEIRGALRRTSMLPIGIQSLNLPNSVSEYLDLLSD